MDSTLCDAPIGMARARPCLGTSGTAGQVNSVTPCGMHLLKRRGSNEAHSNRIVLNALTQELPPRYEYARVLELSLHFADPYRTQSQPQILQQPSAPLLSSFASPPLHQ
jgi:hypothetical protein